MRKKITITLGADESRLLESILASKWVQLETAEQAIVWSLGVANLFLEEYAKQEHPVLFSRKSKETGDKGLSPELAPSPLMNPFDTPGIKPGFAPEHPVKDP